MPITAELTDGKTHPILSNIYGSTEDGPASAELHVSVNGTDKVFEWRDREASAPELAQIAVFDSKAAALYVDESNHIAFLPFNLDLPHKLNGLCSVLRERLEKEHRELSAALAAVLAQVDANTAAGRFLAGLSAKTTSAEVDNALTWTDEDENRCREIMKLLDSPGASAADLELLAAWLDALAITMAEMDAAIGPERVTNLRTLTSEARSARAAANGMAKGAFAGDYLAGVGSDSWRRMYLAAREYSAADAYPGHDFPMVEAGARCVMCQQEIGAEATDRLMRFEAFVSGSLARTADRAEEADRQARREFTAFPPDRPANYAARTKQVEERNSAITHEIAAWFDAVDARYNAVLAGLTADNFGSLPPVPPSVAPMLRTFAEALRETAKTFTGAIEPEKRLALTAEQRELTARRQLSVVRDAVLQRIDDLKLEAALKCCIDTTATNTITRKAGEFSDKYLTPQIKELLGEEVAALNIAHLNPNVLRKPDRTSTLFKVELKAGLKAKVSEVLSEGEHRAIALASFLAEVRSMSDMTPIVIDDPVSSLDHARSILVANRLAAEAKGRQVIIFTHSLVFYHHIMKAADEAGVGSAGLAIFRTGSSTGLIDPGGVPWGGRPVLKRVNLLKDHLAKVKKLANESPEEYEREAKSLYGRMRDCWERIIEEKLFANVITRFNQEVRTKELRFVDVTDEFFQRIEAGMTRTSTYSHDNPASGTAPIPTPDAIATDLQEIQDVLDMLDKTRRVTEARRAG